MASEKSLKDLLVGGGIPLPDAKKILNYVNGARRDEQGKEPKKQPVTNNSDEQIQTLALKYWNLGLLVDGINVVITGRNMAMVTFNGYKNKVLHTYPETQFDIQLVREGDTFSVAKESGGVMYSHTIANPFEDKPIVGAYVVFKNKRGEYIETLNKTDYEKMKKASKQDYLWGQWESEFWLKSVIKRACKRHFYDVVADIDRNDNDDYGAVMGEPPKPKEDEAAKIQAAIKTLEEAQDMDELKHAFVATKMMEVPEIVAAKDKRKSELAKGEKADPPKPTTTVKTPPQKPANPVETPEALPLDDEQAAQE